MLRVCSALLRMRVAWRPPLLAAPVVSYTTFSPLPHEGAVIFCGPVRGLPRPGVTRHPALGSADFPQGPLERGSAIARPTDRRAEFYHSRFIPSSDALLTGILYEAC